MSNIIPAPVAIAANDVERFRRYVAQPSASGCQLWTGGKNGSGYGKLKLSGRVVDAHRVSYMIHCGAIPPGMYVCHRCDVPACVAPGHLFLGTALTNNRDAVSKRRTATGDRSGARRHPERFPRGERVWLAKMTAARVREMRQLHASGMTVAELLKRFPVNESTTYKILNRKIWKHVT